MNRKQIAALLHAAYPALDPEEVRRLLDEAERVKTGDIRYLHVHKRGGRRLTVEPLDFPS